MVNDAAVILRSARERAQLSQAALAQRVGCLLYTSDAADE